MGEAVGPPKRSDWSEKGQLSITDLALRNSGSNPLASWYSHQRIAVRWYPSHSTLPSS